MAAANAVAHEVVGNMRTVYSCANEAQVYPHTHVRTHPHTRRTDSESAGPTRRAEADSDSGRR